VRCGYPVVAFPTGKDRKQTWPNEPYGAGGGFDYFGGGP